MVVLVFFMLFPIQKSYFLTHVIAQTDILLKVLSFYYQHFLTSYCFSTVYHNVVRAQSQCCNSSVWSLFIKIAKITNDTNKNLGPGIESSDLLIKTKH